MSRWSPARAASRRGPAPRSDGRCEPHARSRALPRGLPGARCRRRPLDGDGRAAGRFAPEVGMATRRSMAAGDTLRVVTYNIRDGGADPASIAEAFRTNAQPRQCRRRTPPGSGRVPRRGQHPDLAARPRARHGLDLRARSPGADAGTLGDAIISRYPLDDFAVMHLPIAPRKRQRIAVAATLTIGDIQVRLVTTHLERRSTSATASSRCDPR